MFGKIPEIPKSCEMAKKHKMWNNLGTSWFYEVKLVSKDAPLSSAPTPGVWLHSGVNLIFASTFSVFAICTQSVKNINFCKLYVIFAEKRKVKNSNAICGRYRHDNLSLLTDSEPTHRRAHFKL